MASFESDDKKMGDAPLVVKCYLSRPQYVTRLVVSVEILLRVVRGRPFPVMVEDFHSDGSRMAFNRLRDSEKRRAQQTSFLSGTCVRSRARYSSASKVWAPAMGSLGLVRDQGDLAFAGIVMQALERDG